MAVVLNLFRRYIPAMDDGNPTLGNKGGSSENRRKRLLFRAQRRGFKEVDLIFGAYAEAALAGLDEIGLDRFEALLTAPDQDVYDWLRGAAPVPAEHDHEVFAGLQAVIGHKDAKWNA
jgi:antitoxin CptB